MSEVGAGAAERRGPATIYDIATEVGVSPSTVSRALNRPGRIAAATEQRIREAAELLGYVSNPMARALPTGRSGTLGLVISDITNPAYFDLIRGAERVAAQHGYQLVLTESQESAEAEFAAARRIQPSVDGIALVGSRLDDESVRALGEWKPVVVVNRRVDGIVDITPDVAAGIGAALDHLAELGHRSIAYLAGPAASWVDGDRWRAIFDAAVERGMSIVSIGPLTPTVDGGRAVFPRVRASGVSAVIAYNDLIAIGLVLACQDGDVEVPSALSVVGIDDIFAATILSPPLTSIRMPFGAAGEEAVLRLLSGSDEEPEAPRTLRTELVVRRSTGPFEA